MAKDALTDLEGATLALIARDGPITAYALARAFSRSPSKFWSGSSGAIYPLIARIEARKLIAGESATNGKRNATAYALTPQGRAAMEGWLLDVERSADMGFDPLRTRLFFLSLVSPAKRARFLDGVTARTAALEQDERLVDDPPSVHHINLSWVRQRLVWLKGLRRRMT